MSQHPWVILSAGVVCACVLVGCTEEHAETKQAIINTGATEVLPTVYDDGKSSVYIRVNPEYKIRSDAAIADIIEKKRVWELTYPTRRIVTMSVVTEDPKGGQHGDGSFVVGLLIHYEQQ